MNDLDNVRHIAEAAKKKLRDGTVLRFTREGAPQVAIYIKESNTWRLSGIGIRITSGALFHELAEASDIELATEWTVV